MNGTRHTPPLGLPPARDVLCLGETMVMITPDIPGELTAENARLRLHVGGAESNVAMNLAQLGIRSAWWSRVGDDALGSFITDRIAEAGVMVVAHRDPDRHTGVYFKDIAAEGTRVIYCRRDSAASAMSVADLDHLPGWSRLLHVSGITPALSASADALIGELVVRPRTDGQLLSFDVNHRAKLWPRERAAARLAELGDHADILFVGLDEAEHLWGVTDPRQLRDVFPRVPELVVKDGEQDATTVVGDEVVRVPAPRVRVVEVVGAGDAFAAGYLAAHLRGEPVTRRLMAGHLTAREAIQHTGDVPDLPAIEVLLERTSHYWRPHPGAVHYTLAPSGTAS